MSIDSEFTRALFLPIDKSSRGFIVEGILEGLKDEVDVNFAKTLLEIYENNQDVSAELVMRISKDKRCLLKYIGLSNAFDKEMWNR